MTESWRLLGHQWERLRWARLNRTEFKRAKDAAESLGIKPGTYRTYEYDPADNGREPPLSELQRICRKYKVNWIWVAAGEGSPDEGVVRDARAEAVTQRLGEVDPAKQDDAFAAMMGVLDAYRRKAS
jgi:hypothetical protein